MASSPLSHSSSARPTMVHGKWHVSCRTLLWNVAGECGSQFPKCGTRWRQTGVGKAERRSTEKAFSVLLRAPSPLGGDGVGEGTAQAGGGSGKKDAPAADDGLEGPWGERGEGGGGGGGGGGEPGPPGSTVLLLCLNWHTFTDANGMLAALTKRALDEHIPITLVHEQDESMGGCPFRMFLDQTPLELQQPPYNLFRTLAVPYFSGSDFLCTVSRRYTLRSIGAKPLLGRHSVPAAPRLRQPGPLVMSQRPVAHHYVYGV